MPDAIRLLADIEMKFGETQAAVDALPMTREEWRARAIAHLASFRRSMLNLPTAMQNASLQVATEFANVDGILAQSADALTAEEKGDLPAAKACAARVRAVLDRAAADIAAAIEAEKPVVGAEAVGAKAIK
jgi:hypothetical protein